MELGPKPAALQHFAVHDVFWRLAARGPGHPLRHGPAGPLPNLPRGSGPVGGEKDVLELEERILRRERLHLEDIEPSSRDPSFPEARDQSLLVDKLASSHVDEVSA